MSSFTGFPLFCLLYLLPYLGGVDLGGRMNPVVFILMERVVAEPAFQRALVLTVGTHLVLLALCLPVHRMMSLALSSAPQVRPALASLVATLLLWLDLYGLNQWLFHESRHQWLGGGGLLPLLALSMALSVALLAVHVRNLVRRPQRKSTLALSAVVLGILTLGLGYNRAVVANVEPASVPRNVIIIGIDSLSQRVLQRNLSAMPRFHDLYRQAVVHTNAWSPMGRTCPTWQSILSGRSPAEHGGVFNLRHPDQVDRQDMLPNRLQQQGYGTVFALDERRFCSIDESFGFDAVVGPDHGALDFLIQKFNDSPLVNAFLQTRLSAFVLPHSRLNVAAQATYPAADFVEAVSQAAASQHKRLFMAVHLESAHYPYVAREAKQVVEEANGFRAAHVNALTVVDGQIDLLMQALQEAGRLDDALVVFLSDHGESFGDVRKIQKLDQPPVEAAIYGHGTSVLMPEQHHVVLAYLQYRGGRVVNRASQVDAMVSLLDVKPFLVQYVEGGRAPSLPERECVTFETGIRMSALADYTKMDEKQAAEVGASIYTVDAHARMHLREERMAELIRMKDVGARCGEVITKYDSDERKMSSFREAGDGFVEVPLQARGRAAVDAYRAKLARVAEHAEQVNQLARSQ